MTKLYHGTNVEFEELNPALSRKGLDFGPGAYLTPDIEQAWGMAKRKQMVLGGRRPVMEYEFDESCLADKTSGCLHFETYNEDWTAFVLKNRNKAWRFSHNFPIIAGPVADGVMPTVIEDYLRTYPEKNDALAKKNLSRLTSKLIFNKKASGQVCSHTSEAIHKYLKFIKLYEQ